MTLIWSWIKGFFAFWYTFIIGDDWVGALGVGILIAGTWGLLAAGISAFWFGPVVIIGTGTLLVRRALNRRTTVVSAPPGRRSSPRPRTVADLEAGHDDESRLPPVGGSRLSSCDGGGQLKLSPQAQELVALGLSMVKPCLSMVSAKSIVAPSR